MATNRPIVKGSLDDLPEKTLKSLEELGLADPFLIMNATDEELEKVAGVRRGQADKLRQSVLHPLHAALIPFLNVAEFYADSLRLDYPLSAYVLRPNQEKQIELTVGNFVNLYKVMQEQIDQLEKERINSEQTESKSE